MAIYSYQELQEKISKCNNNDLYNRICKNIKKLRKEQSVTAKRAQEQESATGGLCVRC